MAKRGMKQSFCSGRIRQETKADAKAYFANMARRGVARHGVPECWRCSDCGGWHVLRLGAGKTAVAAGVPRG